MIPKDEKPKNGSRHRTDVLLVIGFLGFIGWSGMGGILLLIHEALTLSATKGSQPATNEVMLLAGLLSGPTSLIGVAIGALGSLLTSTRQHEMPAGTPADPINTKVNQPISDPIPVEVETPTVTTPPQPTEQTEQADATAGTAGTAGTAEGAETP